MRGVYADAGRTDVRAVLAAHHEKAVWELPPSAPFGGVLVGTGPLGEYLAALFTQLGGGLGHDLDRLIVAGDRVWVTGHFVMAGKRVRFADLWQLHAGLVRRRVLATDTATAFAELSGL